MKTKLKVLLLAILAIILVACPQSSGNGTSGSTTGNGTGTGGSSGGSGNGGGVTPKPTLGSISVTQNYLDDYLLGNTIELGDITVMARYSDGSEKEVTTYSTDADFSSLATDKQVTVTYTEDDVTETDTFTVNVVARWSANDLVETLVELPAGTDGSVGTTGKYVLFGNWPQTIKSETVKVQDRNTKQVGMFSYCVGDDGCYYVKILENAFNTRSEYAYSDGTLPQKAESNSYKFFKVEQLKWRILEETTEKKTLFSETAVMGNVPFYDIYHERLIDGKSISPNNYKHSKIRAWLNGLTYNKNIDFDHSADTNEYLNKGFFQTAFNSQAQNRIMQVEVDNSLASVGHESNGYLCENTNDKVFLLSLVEGKNTSWFADESSRIRHPTDFALATYVRKWNTENTGVEYSLRSPDRGFKNSGYYVDCDGKIRGQYVYGESNARLGIVPALCITP